ncbi:MAG: hypothetical protein K0Q93_2137 [Nocardioidaceae bacterium]|nr:hypothetical protein [Nocardioidaceae bacterium]
MATRDLVFTILGIDKGSEPLDDVGAAADRTAKRLDSFGSTSTKVLAALPVAAAGAGVITGGALGLVGAGFVGLGAVILKSNEEVSNSWGDTVDTIVEGAEEAAEPLVGPLSDAADQVSGAFTELKPQLREAFAESVPAVRQLTAGVIEFSGNAMPGFVTAVRAGQSTVGGFRVLLGEAGEGVSDFFTGVSTGADSSGQILASVGGITRDLLGFTGNFVAMLSNEGVGTVDDFEQVLGQLLGTAEDLGGSGLPILFGSASTVLDVVSQLLTIVGPLAPALGAVGGVAITTAAGLRLLTPAATVLTGLGDRIQNVSTRSGSAQGAVRGLGSGVSALGAYGAVAGASLLGLNAAIEMVYGSSDELAAQLMAGGNAADFARTKLSANDAVVRVLDESVAGLGGALKFFIPTSQDAAAAVDQQRASMSLLERSQIDVKAAQNEYLQAVERHGPASDQATAASVMLAHQQSLLEDAQYQAATATRTLTDRMLEQQQLSLGLATDNLNLRIAENAYSEAVKATATATRDKGAASQEAVSARLQEESAALRVISAVQQESLAHYANKGSQEAQTAATGAANAKALELAASIQGPVTGALATFIGNMDGSALSAQGATRSIDDTGAAVIRLDDGKIITIEAKDLATATINGIQGSVNSLQGRTIDILIRQTVTTTTTPGQSTIDFSNPAANLPPGRARGGPVEAGQPYVVGEQGPELIFPVEDGFVATASETRQIMSGGRTDSVRAVGGTGGREVHHHYHLTVHAGNSVIDLQDQYRRMQMLEGV